MTKGTSSSAGATEKDDVDEDDLSLGVTEPSEVLEGDDEIAAGVLREVPVVFPTSGDKSTSKALKEKAKEIARKNLFGVCKFWETSGDSAAILLDPDYGYRSALANEYFKRVAGTLQSAADPVRADHWSLAVPSIKEGLSARRSQAASALKVSLYGTSWAGGVCACTF